MHVPIALSPPPIRVDSQELRALMVCCYLEMVDSLNMETGGKPIELIIISVLALIVLWVT